MLSFCDYDVLHPPRWLALTNYSELLSASGDRGILLKSFWNAGFMSVIGIPLTMIAGLGIALLLNAKVRGMHYYRTAYYLPSIAPVVANAILWLWLLNPQYGIIDHVWATTFTKWFGWEAPNWMTDENWSKPAFILMGVWGAGSGMILWLAGLQGVPQHLYEAAELDGAGAWQRFRYVTYPNISPIVMFALVTGVIQTMQYYTQAIVAGKVASGVIGGSGQQFEPGYPHGSTWTLPQMVYSLGFQRFDTGSACVVALVLFAISMAVTSLLLRRRAGFLSSED
jgi:multiple sugar transport system permease protein